MPTTESEHFLQFASDVRPEIDAALEGYTSYDHDCPQKLRDAIRHSLLAPGKRLRPLLVLMSAEACGSTREAAMPAACAVEMIHTYSLIHDDLPAMDDDDLRRGLPTLHKLYDEATAILAGDALLTQAFEVMATGVQPPATATACCRELAVAAGGSGMVGGQVDDLAGEFSDGGIEQLQAIHRRKTGAMFVVSLRLGGIIAQVTANELDAMGQFGRKLGLAFQIVDDLLDVGGAEDAMGKKTGKDSTHGKLTFPGLLGVEESTRQATQLIEDACEQLSIFGQRASHLNALARYVLERNQ